jgi:hypothetical protein
MAWFDSIADIVTRYTSGGGGTASAPADPHSDYCNIANSAPSQVLADALAHTFRSDQTPSFPEMASTLFRQSNPNQQAGLLNQLMGAIGPAALASIPGLGALANRLGSGQSINPEMATQVSAEQVQQIAHHAERNNPSIVDQVSGFYAQHPDVVKALGGAAITIAIQHIAQRKQG